MLCLLRPQAGQPFGEFNSRSIGIRDECDFQSILRHFLERSFERNSRGLKFPAEGFESLDFKSNVIQRTTLRGRLHRIGLEDVYFSSIENSA